MNFPLALVLLSSLYLQTAAEFDGRWPRQIVSSIGLCRYGGRIDCCWGWARQSWGQCQPVCQPQCKHGECIGPNKCKCHPGYAGKTCNQDLNECGLKPRPCKHRCMNTFGSYKCYCLNGYMLMPDGSCSSALTCSMANCQYGCDVVKGQVRCQCPSPGLQLAPDGRTCVDVDECATGRVSCPRFRQCVNTFGSYICKCHKGFDLMYIGGKYQCHDIDECSLGQHQCSGFARCYNIHGSYKCKCKDGYHGDGFTCVYIPKVMIEPSGPIHVPKGNGTILKGDGGDNNWIPDVRSTRWPLKTPYIPPVITNRPTSKPTTRPTPKPLPQPTPPPPPLPTEFRTPPPPPTPERPPTRLTTAEPATSTSARGVTVDNRIQTDPQKPRGDVFIPRQPSNDLFEIFEIERGISADDEAKDDPGVLIHSCSFDHGLCGWIREKDNDLHWEPIRDPAGGQYLTVSAAKASGGKAARLVLPLGHLMHSGDLCLSFRHKVTGLHSGTLQVFVRKHGAHGAALWGRNGGHGWRQTQITLRGADVKSVIFKGEKRHGHTGEIGLDDVSLRKGHCSEQR
ncbi:nephronectin isoform X4 [Marmota monax]|uniref:Nephronectin n=1 Tax=Marmota monax TaxID=9995 RepID=A0A834QHC8_MARMO|nr:nephronectin isoform X4 [Marmota marmota marmota]XP_027791228.1 nephronectin isoform X5 [Marmota flaviventris]XP_046315162.1 nephronectin isoform X4 [Marmota monax]KAF7478548.1 nephronectin [Marmota monax]